MSTRRLPSSAEPGCTRRRQRGAASLVVVLVLFLVVSLVAAYTSRNLIFEQRTGINQYRSTQALEAAEAGLEWTIQMLNAGLIDTACAPDPSAARSFPPALPHHRRRQRHDRPDRDVHRRPRLCDLRARRRQVVVQLPGKRHAHRPDSHRGRPAPGVRGLVHRVAHATRRGPRARQRLHRRR
ncbi:MAG: PilX N-terminal domain-containing pilus assembly protein [Comamonadaceae bacterium]|nr:PilX N-terminal domain-containing pilus assembly protein [Comamonadaceae bacterium]